jgi:hypothetical protein
VVQPCPLHATVEQLVARFDEVLVKLDDIERKIDILWDGEQ